MTLLTNEQQLAKSRLEEMLKRDYSEIIPRFFMKQIMDLDENVMVLTTAYGVNREKIFFECLDSFLEKRKKSLESVDSQFQLSLFDFMEDKHVTN